MAVRGIESRIYDVAIAGSGVAGASLAAALASAGLGVLIVERERRFRDRVRGEGIHPWGVAEAEELGLLPALERAGAHELQYWQSYDDGRPMPEPDDLKSGSIAGHGEYGVYHPALQNALFESAVSAGADVLRPAKATAFRRDGERSTLTVQAGAKEIEVKARLVVATDGRLSGARKWIGARTLSDPQDHHLIGGLLVDQVEIDDRRVHISGGPGGFTLIFPQGGRRVRAYIVALPNIAEPLRPPAGVDAFLAWCNARFEAEPFRDAVPAGPLAFFPGTNMWADRLADDGIVLAGDAAMATDPSVGHGVSLCFRDARELRDLLLDGGDWAGAIREFERRRQVYQEPIRCIANWMMAISLEVGAEADARRERVQRARQADPSNGGYRRLLFCGPDGLPTDDAARRHCFGEDL